MTAVTIKEETAKPRPPGRCSKEGPCSCCWEPRFELLVFLFPFPVPRSSASAFPILMLTMQDTMTHASNLWKLTVKHHRCYQNECMSHKPFSKISCGRKGRTWCHCTRPGSAVVNTAQARFLAHSGPASSRQQSQSPRC